MHPPENVRDIILKHPSEEKYTEWLVLITNIKNLTFQLYFNKFKKPDKVRSIKYLLFIACLHAQ